MTNVEPASIRSASACARSASRLQTEQLSPYGDAPATSTAASADGTACSAPSGPNVSCRNAVASGPGTSTRAGGNHAPGRSSRAPPASSRPPSPRVASSWRRSSSRRSTRAIGPTSVPGADGSPTASAFMASVKASTNSSRTARSTMRRLAAMQLWPLLRKRERTAARAAAGTSASASTTNGSEPPSSSTVFFTAAPARAATIAPTRLPPVNATAATRGSSMSGPIRSGGRTTAVSVPGPKTSSNTRWTASAPPVTLSACLSSTVSPIATAGTMARKTCQNG
nr:hypothetical protein [Actinomadura sp. J1-007]